ncbi:hypothetical protein [Mobiluncus curtisii]|uniref:Helix-turn-helix domain-containing protein n=2 Tax=Mobiluncus curtisii TaxID=2051 RepID=D6ZL55_MOBCV|nr:hypothetical protein [Mobiluncus curtisii]ADI67454.1 hypothetical protein HMPREF0573_11135 [Mobiluncus curtisii ATCC 43063]MCU9987588.1 hypothetical protein [Mobiluncus curtisii]MCV0000730.1 hypothetical protein [Mobiluncus curtisii]MCV0020429.1 hypothetical protein [Mobiluncus curtisii]NMW43314.1 hypothetical protein [Mobiluncus curtisii]
MRRELTDDEEQFLETIRTMLLARPRAHADASRENMHRLARLAQAFLASPTSLNNLVGPVCRTGNVCDWLGVSRQAIMKAVRDGRLLGFRTLDRKWVYPAWQFSSAQAYANCVRMLPPVVDILGSRGLNDFDRAKWCFTPNALLAKAAAGSDQPGPQSEWPSPEGWIRNAKPLEDLILAAKKATPAPPDSPQALPTPRLSDIALADLA